MFKSKKIIILATLSLIACLCIGIISAYGFSESSSSNNSQLPDFLKPGHKTPPPKGEPLEGKIVLKARGKKILVTSIRDYYQNKEYYDRKYGLGDYWREDHSPIEPKGIEYNPVPYAEKNGWPKVFVDKE